MSTVKCLRGPRLAMIGWACAARAGPQVNNMPVPPSTLKDSEMLAQIGAILHLARRAACHDPAVVEDHDIVGDGESQLDVLLDKHDRQAFLLEAADGVHD